MQKSTINYRQIFKNVIEKKYPDKKQEYSSILNKKDISAIDIIELNKNIFGISDNETKTFNQKHRSYSKVDIFKILDYQKKNRLNNSRLALHFDLSRNTVAKWKKLFV